MSTLRRLALAAWLGHGRPLANRIVHAPLTTSSDDLGSTSEWKLVHWILCSSGPNDTH